MYQTICMITKRTYNQADQTDMFYRAGRELTDKHLVAMDLLFGSNPMTDDELRKLIDKRPNVYSTYSGYLGTRVGDGAIYFGA